MPGAQTTRRDGGWVEVTVTSDRATAALQALMARPGVSVLVRPDRVVTAASRLPRLPWTVPAAAASAPGRVNPNPSNVINLTS